ALASAAGEIIQDAAARAVDGIGAAGLHQAQFVERLMRQEWRAGGGFRRSACDCKNGQRSKRSPEQSIHETYLWMAKICQINDGPIASQLGPLHRKVRISPDERAFTRNVRLACMSRHDARRSGLNKKSSGSTCRG